MSETPAEGPAADVPIETLLSNEGWMRGLARSLVLDDARAEDVVQETWLTALREPPRATGSVRGWLASVVRSRAADARKADRRRLAREHAAARGEALGGAVLDAAAATETHRRLVAAVMALDEPYRSAVILRYFEGLPPREVGARTGVPAETARTRVNRGLERLRARLDGDFGDRRRWTAALLPIAGMRAPDSGHGPSHATAGGWAMSTTKTAVLAGVAIVLAIGAWWWLRDAGASDMVAPAPDRPAAETATKPSRRTRPVEEAVAPAPVESTPPAPPAGALVRLRFVDENGAPLPMDAVRQRWGGGAATPALALMDDRALRGAAGGGWLLQIVGGAGESLQRVQHEETVEGVRLRERVPKGRWRVVAFPGASPSTASGTFTVAKDGEETPVDIVLAATPLRVVRLVEDPGGAPIAGATVVPRFEIGDDAAFVDGPSYKTDAAGECRLPVEDGVARTYQRPPTWWATAPGRAASFQVKTDAKAPAAEPLVVKMQGTCDVEGDAFLSDGTPAVGRTVGWRRKGMAVTATCDDAGKFRLVGVPAIRNKLQLFLIEDAARQIVTSWYAEAKPGATSTVRIGAPDTGDTARVIVRVTAGGRPVRGAGVMCGLKNAAARWGVTDADGMLTLAGLQAGVEARATIVVSDTRVSDDFKADPKEFAPLAPGEERKLELDLPAGILRVRVVDAAGVPVPSARVSARPTDKNLPGPTGWNLRPGYASFAGDDGAATLVALPVGAMCDVTVFDDVSGMQGKASLMPGTWDVPGEVTITLAR